MKYIVSAENSSYFYWQLELLIESFLYHGKQDDLTICMAENDKPKNISYCKNLAKYSKKIIHEDFAKDKGKKNLNRLLCVYNLINTKQLSSPFVIIHADMILKNIIDSNAEDVNVIASNVTNKKESVEKILIDNNDYNELNENLIKYDFSMPVLFNYENQEKINLFFLKLIYNYNKFYKDKNYDVEFPMEEAAWKQTIIDSFGHFNIKTRFFSCNIQDEINCNFIHYKNGIIPFFHKKYFKFDQIRIHQDPFESLLRFEETNDNTKYIGQLIKSYRKRK